jgi:hypothetical protein
MALACSCYLKTSTGWTNTSTPGVDSGLLTSPPPAPYFPWFNMSLPRQERLSALVSAMTVDEQISWLDDGCPAIPRLGLPAYSWEANALHGLSWVGVATVFPEVGRGKAALVSERSFPQLHNRCHSRWSPPSVPLRRWYRLEPGFSFFRSLSHGVRRSTWSCQQRWPASSPQRPGQSGWLIARGNVVGALTDACAMEDQCPFEYFVYMAQVARWPCQGWLISAPLRFVIHGALCYSRVKCYLVVSGEVRVDGLLLVVPIALLSPPLLAWLVIGSPPDPQQQPVRR